MNKLAIKDKEKTLSKISDSINLEDSQNILHYGSEAQTQISSFADSVLSTVRSRDADEIGGLLTDLVVNINELNPEDIGSSGGFLSTFPIIGQLFQKSKKFIAKYDNLNSQINKITNSLDKCKISLVKDILMLNEMYEKNVSYLNQIDLYIEAGEKKLEHYQNDILPTLKKKASESNDNMRKLADTQNMVNQFEKKLHDLKLTRTVALQTLPQIRMIQTNDHALAEKVQSAVIHTVPLWKNQMVLAISGLRQKKSLQLHKYISDTTNTLISKNAEMLKDNSLNISREMEKGVIDVEILKKSHENIISTLNEIIEIQEEGKKKRMKAEIEISSIERQFKEDIIKVQNKREILSIEDEKPLITYALPKTVKSKKKKV